MFRAGLSPSRSTGSSSSSALSHLRQAAASPSRSTGSSSSSALSHLRQAAASPSTPPHSPKSTPASTSLSTPPHTPRRIRTASQSASSSLAHAASPASSPITAKKRSPAKAGAALSAAARAAAGSSSGSGSAGGSSSSGSAARSSDPFDDSSLAPGSDSLDELSVPRMAIVDELDDAAPAKQNVVVCVRVRPPASKSEAEQLWALNTAEHRLTPTEQHPSLAKRVGSSAPQPGGIGASASSCDLEGSAAAYDFRFDSLVGPDDSTDGMYAAHISPLVRAAVQGYNGTVFAYGQTGSGKTHTMSGSATEKGVIDRAVEEVWTGVREDPSREFLLRVSYLEIYNETLRDLLAPLPASQDATDVGGRPASPTKGGNTPSAAQGVLRIMETPGRVQVVGLREDIVTSPSGVLALLAAGQAQRAQAATDWNERSSRSHCVFTITIESRARDSEGKEVRISQLNLIDLAGSERAASEAERRKEGAFINKSLLTLGTVIAKLSEAPAEGAAAQHIPYRDSKLTRLLQNSLGGNARVAVVCTMSPAREHAVESLSTLKFGRRCKMVTTRARRGTVVDDKALLQRYRRELDRLRARLEAAPTPVVMSDDVDDDGERRLRELEDRRQEAQREVDAAEQQRSDLRAQVEHLTRLILTSQSVAEERAEPTSMLSVPRRAARLSDIGPSSPARLGLQPASPIIPATRPFALEAELASLRRELASALSARQAAEAARRQEAEQWSGRAAELEAANKALEDDLDAADTWCKDAKERIAAAEAREHEAREANRLLQLVAKSKTGRDEAPESADARQVRETSQRLAVEQARREVEQAKDAELRRIREEHEAMAAQLAALNTSLAEERKNAEQARTELSEIQRESLQENAERDFEQLVRESEQDVPSAAAKDDAQQVELQRRQAELDERERKLDEEARRLEELRNAPRPLPVPSPTGPSRTELLQRLKTLEEANAALTLKNAEPLPPRATLPMSPNFVASKPGPSHDGATLVALQIELDLQRSRIASLERQLAEEREKGRQVGSALSSPPTPSASPVRRQTAALLATDKLARGGSVREYRKYAPSEPAGSLLGRTRMSAAGDLNTGLGRGGAAVDEAIRAEREEITRLNAVITSQRAIMAELEKSVAAWKERLRKQQEIISRLVEGSSATADLSALTAAMAPSPAPSRLQEVTLNSSGRKRLSSGTASSSAVSSFGTEPLRRAGTTTSAFGRAGATTSSSSPYYGAHTFNRPPAGLGLTPSSPTKAAGAYWSGLPGGPGPEPLPMPERLAAEGRTARRRPRRTIESEIAALSSSPRVEATKSRLLEPSSPAKLSHALPVPTRATREYYV